MTPACRSVTVEAIFADTALPDEYQDWLELNAEAANYPIISGKQPALYGPNAKAIPNSH